MLAKPTLRVFALLVALVAVAAGSEAFACCGSSGVAYQAAYAPVATTAAVPVYTTTASSGWYPGYWLGRMNRSIWGVPSTTTYVVARPVVVASATPTTAFYAPSFSSSFYSPSFASGCSTCGVASYAPACSNCTASYSPAVNGCSSCTACTAGYAPACGGCGACDACGGATTVGYDSGCANCGGAVTAVTSTSCPNCSSSATTQAVYQEPAVSAPYSPATTTAPLQPTPSSEPQPTLAPTENPPSQRTYEETQKPAPADPPSLQTNPEPAVEDDGTTRIDAPKLFDPNDRTAQRHPAPVWTAVYHKTTASVRPAVREVSLEQAEADATGWTSATE